MSRNWIRRFSLEMISRLNPFVSLVKLEKKVFMQYWDNRKIQIERRGY